MEEGAGDQNQDSELEKRVQEANALPWLYIDDLGWGAMLMIKSKDKTYEMKVLDPPNRKVIMIQGIPGLLSGPKFATVIGSIIDPNSEQKHYKSGGIAVGLPLVVSLAGDDFYTLLEPTMEVYVNGEKVLPNLNNLPKREK